MPDLNANDIDAAAKIIAGTARSMGVTVDRLTPPVGNRPTTQWEGADQARRPARTTGGS